MSVSPYVMMAALWFGVGALSALEMVLVNAGWAMPLQGLTWLRVHTIVLGGLVQLVFGFVPGLAARRSGARPPGSGAMWTMWALLNLGIVMVLAGQVSSRIYISVTGALTVMAAVSLFCGLMIAMARRGTEREGTMAAWYYAAAAFYFLWGITMALTIVSGWPTAPGGPVGARESHIHANAWGFLNLVLAVAIYERLPALLKTPIAFPQLGRWTWGMLTLGGGLLILGPWAGVALLTEAGLPFYFAGIAIQLVTIVATLRRARHRDPSLWHLAAGYFWLLLPAAVAPFVLIMGSERLPVGRIELVAVQSLISGWALQVAMALVPRQLAAALGRPVQDCGRHRPALWAALAAVNVGCALFWVAGLAVPNELYGPVLAAGYALVIVGWVPFLGRIFRTLAGAPAGDAPAA